MTPNRIPRRSITGIVERAIAGGQHRVDIDASTGHFVILPLAVSPAQGDAAALDAEIQELLGSDGDAAH